jgi:hypothetical protein
MWVALASAAILASLSVIAPSIIKPLNIIWFRFGLILHRIVNPIVMFAIFAVVFVPAGAIMRLWRDPLRSKRIEGRSTYWIERKKNEDSQESMLNQF